MAGKRREVIHNDAARERASSATLWRVLVLAMVLVLVLMLWLVLVRSMSTYCLVGIDGCAHTIDKINTQKSSGRSSRNAIIGLTSRNQQKTPRPPTRPWMRTRPSVASWATAARSCPPVLPPHPPRAPSPMRPRSYCSMPRSTMPRLSRASMPFCASSRSR